MKKGTYLRKRRSKLWTIKWQQTHNYQQLNLKNKNENKNKLSKQVEQEQNHKNGDHMKGYQQGGGRGRMAEKLQGIRSIIGRYKIERVRVKNGIWNGEFKELLCMNNEHELK